MIAFQLILSWACLTAGVIVVMTLMLQFNDDFRDQYIAWLMKHYPDAIEYSLELSRKTNIGPLMLAWLALFTSPVSIPIQYIVRAFIYVRLGIAIIRRWYFGRRFKKQVHYALAFIENSVRAAAGGRESVIHFLSDDKRTVFVVSTHGETTDKLLEWYRAHTKRMDALGLTEDIAPRPIIMSNEPIASKIHEFHSPCHAATCIHHGVGHDGKKIPEVGLHQPGLIQLAGKWHIITWSGSVVPITEWEDILEVMHGHMRARGEEDALDDEWLNREDDRLVKEGQKQ